MIDGSALHNGSTVLDEPAAVREALDVVVRAGRRDAARVDAAPDRVCVSITRVYEATALSVLSIGTVDVEITSCAVPRTG